MTLTCVDTTVDAPVLPYPLQSGITIPVTSMLTPALRMKLFKFAQARLHDVASAEDAVQEALACVIQQANRFQGDSSFSTYVHGILKHKISDALRQRSRVVRFEENAEVVDDSVSHDSVAHDTMEIQENLGNGPLTPERQMELQQLRQALDGALATLQPRTRQAFILREVMGMNTHQISLNLGISPSNLWTMLHRARKSLKRQLCAHDGAMLAS